MLYYEEASFKLITLLTNLQAYHQLSVSVAAIVILVIVCKLPLFV